MNLRTNPAAGLIKDELETRGIAPATAARDMDIPRSRLSDIFAERKGVSADTALRIERYLGVSASLLMRLQADFDLSKANRELRKIIEKTVKLAKEATPHAIGSTFAAPFAETAAEMRRKDAWFIITEEVADTAQTNTKALASAPLREGKTPKLNAHEAVAIAARKLSKRSTNRKIRSAAHRIDRTLSKK